jgi:hypothetical protein
MPEDTKADDDHPRNPRFSCGGLAKISLLPSTGILFPGKIRDLSLGGCCVDTPVPIECGARAEIVVHANSASFRAWVRLGGFGATPKLVSSSFT